MAEPFYDLMNRARSGEPEAISELLSPHLSQMNAFVRLRFPKDLNRRESANDIVQALCFRVIEDLAQVKANDEAGFRAWLYQALKHQMLKTIEHHRAGRRDYALENQLLDSQISEQALLRTYGATTTPSQNISAREENKRIEAAFEKLPEHYREAILYVGIAKMSYADTAEIMSRSEDSVRQLTFRARARLATLLDEIEKE